MNKIVEHVLCNRNLPQNPDLTDNLEKAAYLISQARETKNDALYTEAINLLEGNDTHYAYLLQARILQLRCQWKEAGDLIAFKAMKSIPTTDPVEEKECFKWCQAMLFKATMIVKNTKFEGDINRIAVLENLPKATAAPTTIEESKEMPVEQPIIDFQVDPKFDWYQNMTHIFVSMKIKKGDLKNILEVSFGQESLEVVVEGHEILNLKLSNKVVSSQCSYTCGMKKMEFKLKKVTDNTSWSHLEAVDGQLSSEQPMAPLKNNSVPSYPTSSKKKTDFSKVEKEISKDLSKDKEEGEGALNDLFKQIYGRADEETRRAMIKSYQTSGGTVLSTNWGEVGTKNYEGEDRPDAPQGQRWADDRDK